jgi:hypothetical protein
VWGFTHRGEEHVHTVFRDLDGRDHLADRWPGLGVSWLTLARNAAACCFLNRLAAGGLDHPVA